MRIRHTRFVATQTKGAGMSAILQVSRVLALITQIAVSLGRIVVQAVLLPFRILGAVFTTLLGIGTDFLRLVQSRQLSLTAVGLGVLILAVGAIGVFQTNFIIISQDVLYECVWSPLYEVVWKFVIKTIIGLTQILGAAYNTIIEYIVVRGSMWYEDTADIIDCVLRTGDILRLLALPVGSLEVCVLAVLHLHDRRPAFAQAACRGYASFLPLTEHRSGYYDILGSYKRVSGCQGYGWWFWCVRPSRECH